MLDQYAKEKKEIQDHLDRMDGMLFKPRGDLSKHEVKEELRDLSPKFDQLESTIEEIEGMLKTKSKAAKSSKK